MPQQITSNQLKNMRLTRTASVILAEARQRSQAYNAFLSYSSQDRDIVAPVVEVINEHGGRVYIDYGDDRLPEKPDTETAVILRGRIRQSKRLVALVSPSSKGSRWIPWELGVGDGEKGPQRVAIFPVSDSSYQDSWSELQYLGLYQRIVYGKLQGYTGEVWMVYNHHDNTATYLGDWLTN
jgi:hypothetical protein